MCEERALSLGMTSSYLKTSDTNTMNLRFQNLHTGQRIWKPRKRRLHVVGSRIRRKKSLRFRKYPATCGWGLKVTKAVYLSKHKKFRPRPHYTVFKRKRYCFVPDTATIHTTTVRNGSFRKRSPEWKDLKTVLFENAVFLVWTAKTILSENDDVTTTTPPGCRPLKREYTR